MGDPEVGISLSMPISNADNFVEELGKLCRGEKPRSEINLGDRVANMERRDAFIIVGYTALVPWAKQTYELEAVRAAVVKYKALRKNYDANGRYLTVTLGDENGS